MSVAVGTYAPLRWLGGSSPFGLALPDASPTASTMYAPRGVCLTDDALVVADTGNHRLLIWQGGVPGEDHADADVVVGQPDMTSEGPKLFFLPTGVIVAPDGRLLVADAWHHRILVWDSVADAGRCAPSAVLGQPPADGLDGVTEGCGPQRFYWPFGLAIVDGTFWVADTGNRRVLGWLGGVPEPARAPTWCSASPTCTPTARTATAPPRPTRCAGRTRSRRRATCCSSRTRGNHRVLGWRGTVDAERPADVVIGQPTLTSSYEFPYKPQGPRAFRFPYAVATAPDGRLFVGDTSNNRIMIVDDPAATFAAEPCGAAVDRVLGQPSFDVNGENRWDRVEHDTLCCRTAMCWHDGGSPWPTAATTA